MILSPNEKELIIGLIDREKEALSNIIDIQDGSYDLKKANTDIEVLNNILDKLNQ